MALAWFLVPYNRRTAIVSSSSVGSVGSVGSQLYFANLDSGASRALVTMSNTLQVTAATRGTP